MKCVAIYLLFFTWFFHMAMPYLHPNGTYSTHSSAFTRGCPRITLQNGKIKTRPRGRFVKFVCNTGYMLAGERYATCVNGHLDSQLPKCVRPTCTNKVSQPANGFMHASHKGAAVHFLCNAEYELRGPSDIYCDGWKWDNNAPTCLRSQTKPKLSCDFEEPDMCGWTPDLNHDFDWKREQYNTPSGHIGTGPGFDHTKGEGQDGYYMYIESSSRNENDTARLISPVYEKTENEACLEFFYHMYGRTTGTLRVYIKKVTDDWSLDPAAAIFSKSGNQGNVWYRSYQSLGIIDQQYQIVIEGVRGSSYVSDIAIDDVRVIENCDYEGETFSTSTDISPGTNYQYSVESCENRCGEKSARIGRSEIHCDCVDECLSTSTCCPDYLDICSLLMTTEDRATSTDLPNDIVADKSVAATSTLASRLTASRAASTNTPSTSPSTTATTRKPATTAFKATTNATRQFINKTIIRLPYGPRNVTLHIMQPPITPKIVRVVLPTFTPMLKANVTRKVVNVTPKPSKEISNKDAGYVPAEDSDDSSKESWSNELGVDYPPLMRNFSESGKLLSRRVAPDSRNYNVVLIVISAVGLTVLTTVIGVFVAMRYRGRRYSSRRMNASNGDSQSDVRFLTGDEILNFSTDYDDM